MALEKGKGIDSEPSKRLEGKKCFECYGDGHYQTDFPNRKTLTIIKLDEIQGL